MRKPALASERGERPQDSRDVRTRCGLPLLTEALYRLAVLAAPRDGAHPPPGGRSSCQASVSQSQVCPPGPGHGLCCPRRQALPGPSPMLPSHDTLLAPRQPDPRPVLGAGMPPASALQNTVLLCRVQCGLSPASAQVGPGSVARSEFENPPHSQYPGRCEPLSRASPRARVILIHS